MYCVNCGVELKDSERVCPLCKTLVFHPELPLPQGEKPYPEYVAPVRRFNRFGALFVLTFLFLIPAVITLLIDLKINGRVVWSGYVIGGLIVGYVACVLPFWFRHPNPVIFVPCACVAAMLLLLYICLATGGRWFLPLAFPISGIATLLITAVIALLKYLKKGKLYVFGGAFIALGGFSILIEMFITITFKTRFVFWSIYPFIACLLAGMLLIIIAVCKPLRSTLDKRFFI